LPPEELLCCETGDPKGYVAAHNRALIAYSKDAEKD